MLIAYQGRIQILLPDTSSNLFQKRKLEVEIVAILFTFHVYEIIIVEEFCLKCTLQGHTHRTLYHVFQKSLSHNFSSVVIHLKPILNLVCKIYLTQRDCNYNPSTHYNWNPHKT